MKDHNTVLGGTFDRLHIGHISFLHQAFNNSRHVTIGLTKEHLLDKKLFHSVIQSYKIRKRQLDEFQKKNYPSIPLVVVPLTDIYGTAVKDESFTRLIVTPDSFQNGVKINEERKKLNYSLLRLEIVDLKKDIHGAVISSSRIRMGEINRDGNINKDLFSKKLFLPENLRSLLAKPFGPILANTKDVRDYLNKNTHTLVIAVGDIVTDTLKSQGYAPNIIIRDFRTGRIAIKHKNMKADLINESGTISSLFAPIFIESIAQALTHKEEQTIIIKGEEDLLALPAIMMSPLGSIVLYGQPHEGVVVIEVNEEVKFKMKNILQIFRLQ